MAFTNINNPTDYFNTVLYTGNGSTQSITGVGFQPDWVWLKDRDNSTNHMVFDSIRGTGEELHTQNTDSETTQANTLTAFGSDGFSLGSNTDVNNSSQNFVSWNWLASNTTSSNTDGSITSTVSANTTSGFSIVSFTATGSTATVGHGLGSAPKVVIIKDRDATGNWYTYHESIGNTKAVYLDLTNAESGASANFWNNTSPTTDVFSIASAFNANAQIAYCFAEKKGFSKFGSYTGNGSTDGPFLYTGFKPAWFLIKSSSNAEQWEMVDNKRETFNPLNLLLYPDQGAAEFTGSPGDRLYCDFTSNGVKLRGNASSANGSGKSYIYMAFAESPFTTSTGVPTTAR